MPEVILVFANNADAMIATKALKDAGVAAKMIPKPAGVESQANLCLTIDGASESQATSALSGSGVALGGIVKAGVSA
ncbi:MAG TPA: putative Se/S carrier-like protein [Candidatus Tyrphobacter sp.]